MLSDHELFAHLCAKRGISLIPQISEAFKASSITGELQLSPFPLGIPICEIIAQILKSSRMIKTVDLSDCMILSQGLSSIFDALCKGTVVTTLNLRGNNMRGGIVAKLGKVFICNNTLKRLYIDWNYIGSNEKSFITFCEGLAKNYNIEYLDLRYNQISSRHVKHLYKMICKNKSLRSIDLSWNALDLQATEMLLNALHENNVITELVLNGNCVHIEIARAIEKRLNDNRLLHSTYEDLMFIESEIGFSKATDLTEWPIMPIDDDTFPQMPEWKSLVSRWMEKVETQTPEQDINVKVNDRLNSSIEMKVETNAKIADLGKILQERNAEIDLLNGEIATKNTEVNDTRAQLNLLQTQINQLQDDKDKYDSDKAKEIAELYRSHEETKENWRKDYKDLKDSYDECSRSKKEAEFKVRRYEEEIHKSTLKIDQLKDKFASMTREYKDLQSKNKMEIYRLKRESKECEKKHKIESSLLKSALKETAEDLENCQLELQKSRNESRDFYKSRALLKTKLDEAEHELFRYAKLKENYLKVQEEKNALEEKLADSQKIVSSLQRQIMSLQSELVEPERRQNLLEKELALERQTHERLKREFDEKSIKLKDQNFQMERISQQISILNAELNTMQTAHAELLNERERDRKKFEEIISSKERNFSELRAKEVQGIRELYAAFNKYLSCVDPIPNLLTEPTAWQLPCRRTTMRVADTRMCQHQHNKQSSTAIKIIIPSLQTIRIAGSDHSTSVTSANIAALSRAGVILILNAINLAIMLTALPVNPET